MRSPRTATKSSPRLLQLEKSPHAATKTQRRGRKEGKKEGREGGREEGRKEGRKGGREKKKNVTIFGEVIKGGYVSRP